VLLEFANGRCGKFCKPFDELLDSSFFVAFVQRLDVDEIDKLPELCLIHRVKVAGA